MDIPSSDSLPPPKEVTKVCTAVRARAPTTVSTRSGDTLIVSGSMRLVYVQAAAQRSLASLARKSPPYHSLRVFLHTVRPVFPVAALAERTVCCWSHSLL